jgi:hypothetical protein
MTRSVAILSLFLAAAGAFGADQGTVHVEPTTLQGPRPLAKQTEAAVVRDYLDAWQTLSAALNQNQVDLLNQDFVGLARERFAATIADQARLGLRSQYQERSHDIKIIFYSPEGLSIQLIDDISYDVQLLDHDKVLVSQPVRARYVAVLTPTEVRWKVRVLQAEEK